VKIAIGVLSSSLSWPPIVKSVYFFLLRFLLGVGIASSTSSERDEKRLRATALTWGAISEGAFLGVLSGVGSIPIPRTDAIDLCCSTFGGGRPRKLAADAVPSGLSAPEIFRPLIVVGPRGALFLVAVCGDEGDEGVSELVAVVVADARFLEDRGVKCCGVYD